MKIEFGNPRLLPVRRNTPFEIKGTAFVEGFKEPVGFSLSVDMYHIEATIDPIFQAKKLYELLRGLFTKFSEQERGLAGGNRSPLVCSWELVPEKWPELLKAVEKSIGKEWAEAFGTSAKARENR